MHAKYFHCRKLQKNIAFIKVERKGFWKSFGKKLETLNDLRN